MAKSKPRAQQRAQRCCGGFGSVHVAFGFVAFTAVLLFLTLSYHFEFLSQEAVLRGSLGQGHLAGRLGSTANAAAHVAVPVEQTGADAAQVPLHEAVKVSQAPVEDEDTTYRVEQWAPKKKEDQAPAEAADAAVPVESMGPKWNQKKLLLTKGAKTAKEPLGKSMTAIEASQAAAQAATAALVAERAEIMAADAADAAELARGGRAAEPIVWQKHEGKSCQNYVETTERSLEESKIACSANDACAAIECPHGRENFCTLRAVDNLVPYAPADCYDRLEVGAVELHPALESLIQSTACFRPILTQAGKKVNILLVQRMFGGRHERDLFEKYKDEILFLGISSFEDWPLFSGNPFSSRFANDDYVGLYPGFLHMMREPQQYFPSSTKTILMSQSDFNLPDVPPRDYSIPRKYDFTLSGSDQDVGNDCVGWSSFAKNWSFVKEALVVMCGEYNLKGVLVATKSKDGRKACTIPDSCKGKMIQTTFLTQEQYFSYLGQSRFAFLPQLHDASPRVSTQALSHDVPLLMNAHIVGGWKYLNEKTGEFFTDMRDFRQALDKILRGADIPNHYEPRKFVLENYGDKHTGRRLLKYVKENFAHRVDLPKNTKLLIASSR